MVPAGHAVGQLVASGHCGVLRRTRGRQRPLKSASTPTALHNTQKPVAPTRLAGDRPVGARPADPPSFWGSVCRSRCRAGAGCSAVKGVRIHGGGAAAGAVAGAVPDHCRLLPEHVRRRDAGPARSAAQGRCGSSRRRSRSEAAARNLRGYSPVIVDALRAYCDGREDDRHNVVARVRRSLGAQAAEVEHRRLAEVRANWRT